MRLSWVTTLVLLSALLTACMTGPDYTDPNLPVPEKWSESLEGGESAAGPPPVRWWNAFTDPTLDSLVRRAIEANLDLRTAEARVREARAGLLMAEADLWPQLNASASYQRSQSVRPPSGPDASGRASATLSPAGLMGLGLTVTPAKGPSVTVSPDLTGGGNPTATVSMGTEGAGSTVKRQNGLYQAGFDASWEIDVFGGIRRANEAARAEVEAAEEHSRSVLTSVVAELALTYFELRGTQNRLDIARQNVKTLEDSLALVQSRFDAGLTNELDVKIAEAQLATTRSSIPTMEFIIKQAIHRLGVLLGSDPGALQDEVSAPTPLPSAPPEVLVGLPTDLLRRRPDVRQAERTLAAATARIGVATADLFPKFSLTGSFRGTDDTFEGLRLGDNHVWSFGPSVRWPVFDAGRIRANIQVQNARQEQALLGYEKAVRVSLEEVENALVLYAKEQNRLVELIAAVEANQKALDIAEDLYTNGLVNFLNVLDTQRSLFAAQDQLIQSKSAILKNLVSLYKALGGGWEVKEG